MDLQLEEDIGNVSRKRVDNKYNCTYTHTILSISIIFYFWWICVL